MKKALLAVAALAAFAAGGVAQAQGRAPGVRGFQEHDGFYLRLDAGGGYMGSSASSGGTSMKLSGAAGEFSVAAGGAVTDNFIIAGQLWSVAVSSPTVTINGMSGSTSDSSLGLTGFGVDLTYYFMPTNIYVSATPSIATLSVSQGGASASTKSGFAFRLAVGKEWWVSDNWGLGLNAQYIHSSNPDQGSPFTFGSDWFGAAFSATFN
jgi:hypothetical protein